jgi:trk system potassium uptake protein TrkA
MVNATRAIVDDLMRTKPYVVVVGCGGFGAYLASHHSKAGSSVVVIDVAPGAFTALPTDFSGFTIEGNASEYAVLRQAKTNKAGLFIAATGRDPINLFCAQVAKSHFAVPEVFARVRDPELTRMYEGGTVRIICPALLSAEHYFRLA